MRASTRKAAIAVTAIAALAAAGCAESDRDDSGGSSTKDTLVFGVAGDPKVLDPSFASDGESLRVARQVFETLVRPEEGGTKPTPGLAESWQPDAAGTTWSFKLRTGVKFHDGTDFNAEAVCANFNRWFNSAGLMQSPDVTPYWQDVMGGFAKNEDPELPPSLFKSCTAKDPTTVDLAFTRVSSKIPSALMLPSFAIHSPQALQQYDASNVTGTADDIKYPAYAMQHPTGTGPFKFKSWDLANKSLTIERNEEYWGDKAKLKTIVFRTISDENARKQALRSGDIQGYDLVGPADVEPLKSEGFNMLTRPAFNVLYLAINQKGNPALAKLEVRQAIAHALNRQALVDSKLPPGAKVATQFMPDTVEGWNPQVKTYDYNVEEAKRLLAAAGASNLTLRFHYPTEVTRPYMPNPKDIFELLSNDLKAVGITVEGIPLKWSPDYLNATTSGSNHDLHLLGWTGDYGDAYNFIGTFFDRPKDEWGYTNKPLFDQFQDADTTADNAQRVEKYKALNAAVMEFLPGVPISHSPPAIVFGKDVTGVKPSPLTDERYSTAEFK
ncbi:ABC transporter substrate-binding protein [Spirilliplanes yamanashiensis]|uniref:ABC transporter substrate-binding protein n=1 Tax=Spirilliplanes yamanashiensis TaxID=42233 RepID=A0A8J3Y6K2_9ACTN|nr:ABC transporter substrate-binding protein [Spirilliplanes yamanashiensis]MDP9814666.1 peptide/nickel transport system substrate-binding protein [Spirilliplanes yamanashiensis]GIJ02319.1 ABC transporter substrate-binding protein [Spirilliplanes yamanashiensis]